MRYISNSEMQVYLQCKRKYYYKYVLNRVDESNQSARSGLKIHEYLESAPSVPGGDSKEARIAAHVIEDHLPEVISKIENFYSAGVEQELSLKVNDTVGIRGKLDVLGDGWFMDWKTIESRKAMWTEENIFQSPQMRTYSGMYKAIYGMVPTIYIGCIKRVDPKTAKNSIFELISYRFTDKVVDNHMSYINKLTQEIYATNNRMRKVREDAPTFSLLCKNYCAFKEACRLADEGDRDAEWRNITAVSVEGDPNARYTQV